MLHGSAKADSVSANSTNNVNEAGQTGGDTQPSASVNLQNNSTTAVTPNGTSTADQPAATPTDQTPTTAGQTSSQDQTAKDSTAPTNGQTSNGDKSAVASIESPANSATPAVPSSSPQPPTSASPQLNQIANSSFRSRPTLAAASMPATLADAPMPVQPVPTAPAPPPKSPINGLFGLNSLMSQVVMRLTNFGNGLSGIGLIPQSAWRFILLAILTAQVVAGLASLYLARLKRSGYSHAARSDASSINFATLTKSGLLIDSGQSATRFFVVSEIKPLTVSNA